jgi:branched-chain amino acid transport system permease protein
MFPNLRRPQGYVGALFLLLLLAIPLAVGSPFVSHLFILIFIFGALATAWNIVGGFAGQLSLGHAVFYGIGSYSATLLIRSAGISPWLGMLVGILISIVVSLVIAYPTFRLRGPFFALATIAVLEVVRLLVVREVDLTGGAAGLSVPLNIGFKWMIFREKTPYLLITFGFLLLTLYVSWRIRNSRLGFYLVAVREREDAARAVGVNAVRVKLTAAIVSAALTSALGTVHAMYLTFIEPSAAFSLELSIQLAMFALIGGLGSVAGPLAGTLLVLPIAELARGWLNAFGSGMHGLIYGIILVIVVLTMPRGLVGRFGESFKRLLNRLPGAGEDALPAAPPVPASRFKPGEVVLKATHISKRFGGLQATNDVTLELHHGEILGVIGPNGAGKTTVFNQLSGFIAPDTGKIEVRLADGSWATPSTPDEFARAGIGRTFQIAQPFAGLSVRENIMLGAFMHTSDRSEAAAIAHEVATVTDLTDLLEQEARSLTVGGMKRLEVARALATRPHVLLLDEVLAGLNPSDVERAIVMIRRIRDTGVSVLMIEHLMQATMALSDRIIVINLGSVLREGNPTEVVNDPAVIEAYLGKDYHDALAE